LPVFLAGRINDPGLADQLVEQGSADMVAMTRSLIADPEMPNKAREGRTDDVRNCLGANQGCWGRVRQRYPIGCVYNPAAGRESEFAVTPITEKPRKMVVIGGGPAGCETARQAATAGHSVTVIEREAALGGNTLLAAMAPGREDFAEVSRWFTHELGRLGVEVRLGTEVTPEALSGLEADEVVLATGAVPIAPETPGLADCDYWLTLPDAMRLKFDPGKRAVIFTVSREIDILTLADKLASSGSTQVTMLTPHDTFGRNVDESTIASVTQRLHAKNVQLVPYMDLAQISGRFVLAKNVFNDAVTTFDDIDTLVIDVGWSPRRDLESSVREAFPAATVTLVGDCLAPRGIQAAVWDGARAGRRG
jgi:thioredoxin reductase